MSARDFDDIEAHLVEEDRAERAIASRWCPDCRQVGGHNAGCPGEDGEPDDDAIEPMTKEELVRLAESGDAAARLVIANCMECVGEMALIDGASDEELGEWYADARDEVSA
jgi:hypothetical protein